MIPYFPDWLQNWDVSVLNWLQEHMANPILDGFFAFVTHLGDEGILWIALAVIFLFFKKTRKMGITMGVALLLGLILGNGVLKNVIGRVRPYNLEGAYGSIIGVDDLLVGQPGDKSFPSGHTLGSFEAALAMFYYDRRFGIPAVVLAAMIAFSRMYLYLHYPTDIMGGLVLAVVNVILAIIIVNMVYKFIEKKKVSKL